MTQKKSQTGTVSEVKFVVPAFRYKGQEYKSADVEKAAEDGDENALAIIAHLVKMNSGVLHVVSETEEEAETKPKKDKPNKNKEKKEKGGSHE